MFHSPSSVTRASSPCIATVPSNDLANSDSCHGTIPARAGSPCHVRRSRRPVVAAAFLGFLSALASRASATVFASGYVAGQTSGLDATWPNAQAAVGAPSRLNGVGGPFPGILSPFNPNYEASDIVQIDTGGQLTLRLPNFVNVGGGSEIGVVSNVFLQDPTFTGTNANPASAYGSGAVGGGSAEVLVSDDGVTWHSVGTHAFDRPANAFADAADPYQSTAGAVPADFGIPFTHPISDFDGKNWLQTRALFGASGGGTWLDLASSGLTQIDYVQFRVPTGKLVIDSVAINNAAVGAAVPEPAGAALVVFATFALGRVRRRA